jgi:hypothetical protein
MNYPSSKNYESVLKFFSLKSKDLTIFFDYNTLRP